MKLIEIDQALSDLYLLKIQHEELAYQFIE
jgi:hypothetical protein